MPIRIPKTHEQREGEERQRRGRGGRPPTGNAKESRVTIRLTAAEREVLDELAGPGGVAEYLRSLGFGRRPRIPRVVPEVNQRAWAALAPVVANLNQLAAHANRGNAVGAELAPVLEDVRRHVMALRAALLGRDEGDPEAPPP